MQIFIPYNNILDTARVMYKDKKRYNKEIIECKQILHAIYGDTKAWLYHPITKMYTEHYEWLECYLKVFEEYKIFKETICAQRAMYSFSQALIYSNIGNNLCPSFLTEEYCDQHKRRLFTKNPILYSQFAKYGKSEENWYIVNNVLIKYIKGKRIS